MGVQERRAREREARRRLVLDATRELVRERGFNGTTTRLIAERSELSEATVFFYFPTKDEIFVSLLFEAAAFMAEGLDRIIAEQRPHVERVAEVWEFFMEVKEAHPEYFDVSTYLAYPGSTEAVTAETKAALTRVTGENFRRLTEILAPLSPPGKSRVVADFVWSSFLGLMVLRDARAGLGTVPYPRAADLEAVQEIVETGLGIVARQVEIPEPAPPTTPTEPSPVPPRRDWQTVAPPYD